MDVFTKVENTFRQRLALTVFVRMAEWNVLLSWLFKCLINYLNGCLP